MKLEGKTALVTGASRGIGRAIALALAEQRLKRLIVIARNQELLEELATEIRTLNVEVIVLPLDLTETVKVHSTIAKTWRDYGPIHLLVNCAGVAHQAPFLQAKMPDVYQEISLNLIALYSITHSMARRMAARQEGTIVNVSSLMGRVAAPTMSTYSATKFAILGFTEALRRELAPYNIRVVALLPSLTDTDMVRNFQLFRWTLPMTTQRVAHALISGLQKDSSEILVGWQSHLAVLCQRLTPGLMDKILLMAAPLTRKKPVEALSR